MKKLYCLTLLILFASLLNKAFAQNSSNKGKDFWVAYSGHRDGLNSRLTLFLSADQATDYEVYVGPSLVSSGVIAANTCLPVIINPNLTPVYVGGSDVIETDKAIHVVTKKAISLYSIISFNARTGGTLVLPSNTLGKEYYAFSHQTNNSEYPEFTVVATADATDVEITPTKAERTGKRMAGVPFTIRLNKGQIYQYQATADLSGTHIRSVDGCKPIAVFSGNTWLAFCEAGSTRSPSGGDNLYQQLFPVSAWGKKFVTAPFYNTLHGNTDMFKIIVSENNTTLTVNGSTTDANGTPLSNPYAKGSIVTFYGTSPNVISGSAPIAVAHYQTSQTCNLNNPAGQGGTPVYPGDPEITVLNPVEQTLKNITVYSKLENVPTNISVFYLNVIIKTADIPTFRLDGNPVTGFVPIDAEYSYAIIDVTNLQPQHRLTANGGFSAIAYGYGGFESYAYLAGANVQNFTFQPQSLATGNLVANGCLGETLNLKVNLPYQPTQIVWNVGNGDGDITQAAPVPSGSFTKDGLTYYTYSYPNDITYIKAGDYVFSVKATKPSADACGATEDLSTDFTVDEEPTAAFEPLASACQDLEVQFKDKSNANSPTRGITSWLWDFGDGTPPSNEQNPKHTFTQAGTFNVTLTVGTDAGCSNTSMPMSVVVGPKPVAKFTVTGGNCIDRALIINNTSTIAATGAIKTYHWDFGQGAPIDVTNAVPPTFKYTTTGIKTIKLTVTSNLGCVSEVFSANTTVVALPKVDFLMPGYCLDDGVAKFVNLSKNEDGSTTGLTYIWDFGDPASPATTTTVDGAHTYTQTGTYTVTLRAFNQQGCEADKKTQTFVVNPYVTTASFTVQNESNLCSGSDVVINNTSVVASPGRVVKVEVYKDYVNDPSSFVTVDYPDNTDIRLSYPEFGGIAPKNYTIYMVVYTGESCFKTYSKTITIKPIPILTFDAIPAACSNDGLVTINQAKETSGMIGKGVYSGLGIVDGSAGTFNTKIAGVGTHVITYTFVGDDMGACSRTITQEIVVNPSPTIVAENEFYILAGGQKQIDVTANGAGLTYKWTPATGLSNSNILNPVASPETDTKYTLTVTSDKGCTASAEVYVRVLQQINVPNTFSPNGDGINDVWNIKYLDTYPEATVEVFDRNGQKVYFSKGYTVPFNGNFNNKALPVGTYYYIISPNSGRKNVTGALTIIR